jgi:predicted DNA-binding protein
MPKTVRMTLVVSEELWKRLSHLAVEKGQSKNDVILSLIEKGLKTEKSP